MPSKSRTTNSHPEADRSVQVDDKRPSTSTSKSSRAQDNKESINRSNYSTTMLDTVKKANSSEILLNCDDLVSLVLQILSSRTYVDYQKIYLTILLNQILTVKQYQIGMKSAHWKELLKLCISLYEDVHPYIDKSLILKAICEIVQYGCLQSHLSLRLKKIFPFLVGVFNDAKSDPRNLSENTFKVLNAVCQAIGPENRTVVCEFGEAVLPIAIDLNVSDAKYDWILLVVRTHHPGGVSRNDDASYACNWDKWTDILRSIYCMVINDCKLEFTADSFVQLACEVSWQLRDDCTCIDDDICIDESYFERPSKRRRTIIGIQGMIDTLTVAPLKECKVSIQILIALITQYPESIKESNFLPLMEFLNEYISTCGNADVMDQLWELGIAMAQCEDKLSGNVIENDGIKLSWEKMWSITLRSVGIKKHEERVHKLLQSLISYKKVTDFNALLNLYLKDTITWSNSSIHTLLMFCKHNAIQDCAESTHKIDFTSTNHVSTKVRLLQWILAVPKNNWFPEFPVEDVSELLVGLTLKSWHNDDQSNIESTSPESWLEMSESQSNDSSCEKNFRRDLTNVENIHLLTAFKGRLFDEAKAEVIPHCKTMKDNVLYVKENRDLLIRDLVDKNIAISETKHKHILMVQTTLIAKVCSKFRQLNIPLGNIDKSIGTILEHSLKDISLSVEEIVESKKRLKGKYLLEILEALHLFYKTSFENDIAESIRSSTDSDMLRNILLLINIEQLRNTGGDLGITDCNTSVAYIENIDDLSDRHRLSKIKDHFQKADSLSDLDNIRMKACKVLTAFCRMDNGRIMSCVQEDLRITLLSPDNYDLTQIFDSRMAMMVLESLTECEVPSFSAILIDNSLKLLQQLCRIWHKDEETVGNILTILSKLLVHLGSIHSVIQRQNSLRILSKFHEFLQDDKYGPMTYLAFIQCLETIAKIDPIFAWAKWQTDSNKPHGSPVVEDILPYIGSPFHIVRLKARNCLRILFTSKNVDLQWLTEFFTKLSIVINSLFIVKGEIEGRQKEDEKTNRTASALYMMAVVISSNAIFRSKALLAMFQLTEDKNVSFGIVKKVLEKASIYLGIKNSNLLVENNMNYLLTCWLDKEYPLSKFPIVLLQCASEQQFYQKYMNIVVPILIRKGYLSDVHDLCRKFGMIFEDVFENSFPCVMSWILPCISADSSVTSGDISATDIKRATNVFNQLNLNQNEFQTVQKTSVLLENNLESVIVSLLERLHDEEHSMQFLTILINYPPSDPPNFKHKDIERSFKYLEDNVIGTGHSLFHILATTKQHTLQKVLLNLKRSIHQVNSVEQKLKALHQYVYFCAMMMKEIDLDYFDEMSAYVIRDICHTMVHLIKKNIDSISQAACSYFYYLLQSIVPKRHTEFKQNLRLIVASMIPIVKAGEIKHAYDIIMFLIIEQNDVLGNAIERLDSFPMDEVFRQVRQMQFNWKEKIGQKQSLEYEIQHFLSTRGENTEYCSSAELEHLEKQLSVKKTELKGMYQSLKFTHRFSEDCALSMLHRLISTLVKLTTSSDPDISMRAAKCLGEVGPADLSTMILQPEKNQTKKLSNPMLLFTYRVVVLLSNLLIHPDMQLFTSSSEALYVIMASFWGRKISDSSNLNDLKALIEGSEGLLQIEYIRPFITKSCQLRNTTAIDVAKFNDRVNNNKELWIGESSTSHKDWITNITCNILDCFSGSYLTNLISVCKENVSFCEKILPWIIHLTLHIEKKLNTKIYENVKLFFNYHFSNAKELKNKLSSTGMHKSICFNHESVQCMLKVVEFIRLQSTDNCQFHLNFLHIAKAAEYCSAYFTTVLYAELWCETFLRELPTIDCLTSIDHICEIDSENGRALQQILKEAFVKIGDSDAIYGCGASDFRNPSAKIEHYVQLRKWDKVLLAHDIELSLGNETATTGLLDALRHSGLQYLLGAFVKTVGKEKENTQYDNYRYECAWRLSDWNMPTNREILNCQQDSYIGFQNIVSDDYSFYHYQALKSFHEFDAEGLKLNMDRARVSIIKMLRNISLESCKTVYPVLSQLQMLREVEEMYFAEPKTYNLIIEKWNNQDSLGVNDFEYIEPILSQRAILLQAHDMANNKVIENALVNTFLQLAELSKKHGYFQMAARALGSLAKQVELSAEVIDMLQYHEAKLAWMRDDLELGRQLLRNLIVKDSLSPNIRVQALTAYGNWIAETKSENPQKVIEKYYVTALECGKKMKNPTKNDEKNLLDTQAALAQFADAQYQQILTYMKSPQFESFIECVAFSEATSRKLSTNSSDYDERRAACLNKKQNINDVAELENIEKEKNMYLLCALRHYILTLKQGDDHDLLAFRLVSLWLDNKQHQKFNEILQAQLKELPTYKFVLLVPQLAPHMTNADDAFSTQIYSLLKRCAIEHPHHTLPVLLSLVNLHKDHEFRQGKKQSSVDPEPRVLGAQKLIEDLNTTNVKFIIQEMSDLANSLIMLANLETPKASSIKIAMPKCCQSILRIKNFKHTLIPTLSIDVKPNQVYDHVISIQRYVETFELVGGINAPKKITCIGTDGIKRSQLVKGKDDLRQDAVMQQVFNVMNMLLRTSKEATKRKLNVRTYKVVPLTQRCGVLEWCNNTVPTGTILEGIEGHGGLHTKYYPHDYTTKKCKAQMMLLVKSLFRRIGSFDKQQCRITKGDAKQELADAVHYATEQLRLSRYIAATDSDSISRGPKGIGTELMNRFLEQYGEMIFMDAEELIHVNDDEANDHYVSIREEEVKDADKSKSTTPSASSEDDSYKPQKNFEVRESIPRSQS